MAGLTEYTQELFKKAGLDGDEQAKAIIEALGKNEKLQKAFKDGFVETGQHHSTVDKLKGEWEGKYTQAEQKVRQYDEWYNSQAKPAFDQYQKAQIALQQYQATFGPIDTATDVRQAAAATGLSKEDVQAMLNETVQRQNTAYVGLLKDMTRISGEHVQRFKEPLDVDAFEEFANKSGLPPRAAYEKFVAPRVQEQQNTEFEAKIKAAREEGARDALSKHKLPVESGPRESHLVFDRKEPEGKMSDLQQEQASRNAFLEGWNEHNAKAS